MNEKIIDGIREASSDLREMSECIKELSDLIQDYSIRLSDLDDRINKIMIDIGIAEGDLDNPEEPIADEDW